ncbi:MAG: FtsW/RodA/SpoVE family cell cycle protein [Lachnospiraceae bacterium]|nr:FtsW/RodA/SpoVE family cell cycle protein [Lachnospiraceae bacterium]
MFQVAALIARYLYPVILFAFTAMGFYLYLVKPSASTCRDFYVYQLVIIVLFNLLSLFLILAKMIETGRNTGEWLDMERIRIVGIYLAEMILMYVLLCTVHRNTNRLLWNCVYMLLSVSFILLYRLNIEEAGKQVMWIAIGFTAANMVLLIFRGRWIWKIPSWFFLGISLGLILLPFIFPSEANGALNWVSVKGISFQPSEFVKLTFAFFLAVLYTGKNKLTSVIEAGVVTVVLALVLLKQNDLGALLIFGILAWMMTYDYTGWDLVLWGGALLVGLAGLAAYRFVSHVQTRFDIWLDPWTDINGSGYQIIQSLFAIVNGGWFGLGLYQGVPGYIPVNTSDMIFSVIAEEMGMICCIELLLIYLLMFLFVLETGRRERNTFRRNLLIAFGVLFMSQTFIIVGGVIKLIPLTGVTLPFISYGGSSLFSNFVTIAIIEAVIRLYRIDREEARKRERESIRNKEIKETVRSLREREDQLGAFHFEDPF